MTRGGRAALGCFIGLALAGVVVAPLALSSGDLVAWARSSSGLGLQDPWPLVVFVALDCAAAVCVGFVVFNAWMGEGAGPFGLLVWLFAGGSALANYRHGLTTRASDDVWFFPSMSLAGPLLLHATVHRIRRWVRTEAGEYAPRRAHFGLRWLPGVACRETFDAWRESIRAGISNPTEAVLWVRELRYLQALGPATRVRYAAAASGTDDPHKLHRWLLARGVAVGPAEYDWAPQPGTSQQPLRTEGRGGRPAQPREPVAARSRSSSAAGERRPQGTASAPEFADLQRRVEAAFLEREVAGGEELVGAGLARELDGDDRRKRRVQELLNRLRTAPTDAQKARIAAARAAAGTADPPLAPATGGRP